VHEAYAHVYHLVIYVLAWGGHKAMHFDVNIKLVSVDTRCMPALLGDYVYYLIFL